MNYTTNYHLPQWVESDRILMEDFNDAMEALDEGMAEAKTAAEAAYSPTQKPWVLGSATVSESQVDTVIYTFDFTPSLVIAWASGYYLGATDGTTTAMLHGSSSNGGRVYLELSGTQLKLTHFYNGPYKVYFLAMQ